MLMCAILHYFYLFFLSYTNILMIIRKNNMNGNYFGQDNYDMKFSHHTMPNCHVGVKQTWSVGFRGAGIIFFTLEKAGCLALHSVLVSIA